MSSSNCCFLTCIQISQEADQVVPVVGNKLELLISPNLTTPWLSALYAADDITNPTYFKDTF